MGIIFRAALFITSFLPLWVSIAIKNFATISQNPCANKMTSWIVLLIISLINFIAILEVNRGIKSSSHKSFDVVTIKHAVREKAITSEYVIAYILPLFIFDFTDWWEVFEFFIFFSTIAYLCIKNGNVYANIILELQGYSYFTCSVNERDDDIVILSSKDLSISPNHIANIITLNRPVYLERFTTKE